MPTIPEILKQTSTAETQEARIAVLRKFNSTPLKHLLRYAYDPMVAFDAKVPSYKMSNMPEGHHISSLYQEHKRLYLFLRGAACPIRRKNQILLQILELMDPVESQFLEDMFHKDMSRYPGVDIDLINKAFPGCIPT